MTAKLVESNIHKDPPTAEQLAKRPVYFKPANTFTAQVRPGQAVRLHKDQPLVLPLDVAKELAAAEQGKVMPGRPDDGGQFDQVPTVADVLAAGYSEACAKSIVGRETARHKIEAEEKKKQAEERARRQGSMSQAEEEERKRQEAEKAELDRLADEQRKKEQAEEEERKRQETAAAAGAGGAGTGGGAGAATASTLEETLGGMKHAPLVATAESLGLQVEGKKLAGLSKAELAALILAHSQKGAGELEATQAVLAALPK